MSDINPFSPRTQIERDKRLWYQTVKDASPVSGKGSGVGYGGSNKLKGGRVTLAAGTSTIVSDSYIGNDSVVFVFPINLSAANFLAGGGIVYFSYGETVAGTSFVLRTTSVAVGTEEFNYLIFG